MNRPLTTLFMLMSVDGITHVSVISREDWLKTQTSV